LNKESNNKKSINWSQNGDRNVHAFEFIGAVLIYIFKLGKIDSNEISKPENSKRNITVGNIFCGILFILLILYIIISNY